MEANDKCIDINYMYVCVHARAIYERIDRLRPDQRNGLSVDRSSVIANPLIQLLATKANKTIIIN